MLSVARVAWGAARPCAFKSTEAADATHRSASTSAARRFGTLDANGGRRQIAQFRQDGREPAGSTLVGLRDLRRRRARTGTAVGTRARRAPARPGELLVRLDARHEHPDERIEAADHAVSSNRWIHPFASHPTCRCARVAGCGSAARARRIDDGPTRACDAAPLRLVIVHPPLAEPQLRRASAPARPRTESTPARWRSPCGNTGTPAGTGYRRRTASNRPARLRGHDVRFGEDLHRPDHADDRVEEDVRAQHREGDVPEPPPRPGAVDARGFVELLRDRLQPREPDDHRRRPRSTGS